LTIDLLGLLLLIDIIINILAVTSVHVWVHLRHVGDLRTLHFDEGLLTLVLKGIHEGILLLLGLLLRVLTDFLLECVVLLSLIHENLAIVTTGNSFIERCFILLGREGRCQRGVLQLPFSVV